MRVQSPLPGCLLLGLFNLMLRADKEVVAALLLLPQLQGIQRQLPWLPDFQMSPRHWYVAAIAAKPLLQNACRGENINFDVPCNASRGMQKPSASDGAASPTQVQSRLLKGPSFADVVIQDIVCSCSVRGQQAMLTCEGSRAASTRSASHSARPGCTLNLSI